MTTNEVAVRATGLSKRYGAVIAVDDLNLDIHAGETVALLGPNGAGKSTTISMILDQARPDAGTVEVLGQSPTSAVKSGSIGAMLQGGKLPDLATVAELVSLARAIYPDPLPTDEIMAAAGLAGYADRRLDSLSGGEAQRALFALAVTGDPDFVVLDEPTTGMDVEARQRFWNAVRERAAAGRTVLFATHYLAEADEFADRIVMLSNGRVVADGSSAEIRSISGSRTVSFDLIEGSLEGLDGLPGVRGVELRGGRAVLDTDDPDATVAALISTRGAVSNLEVSGAGITDAFLTLTTNDEDS